MRRRFLRAALLALVAAGLAACAAASDVTWIHPDTGAVPDRAAPHAR